MRNYLIFIVMVVIFNGCGGGGSLGEPNSSNKPKPPVVITPDLPPVTSTGFTTVDDATWSEVAVKKVLDTFAYGGHASDTQIKAWADMSPKDAIAQMLTNTHQNSLLSPTTSTLPNTSSLEALASFWSGSSSDNFLNELRKADFLSTAWSVPKNTWTLGVMSRGLNPFLYRLGLWETNYHMSINRDAGVYPLPMIHHYDNIIKKIVEDKPYNEVIAQGAKNAGVAYQFGHNKNIFVDGQFKGNEDFAREYYQLYLGILGLYDPDYHENTTIPYTARALTDMKADWHSEADGGPDKEITFGTDNHYTGELNILKTTIPSSATADTQLDAIAKLGITQQESLDNLPLMIIRHFADDNLTTQAIANIQKSWRDMSKKSIISFLQAYAISTDFHSASRYKYKTSIERVMGVINMMVVDNSDNIYKIYDPSYHLSKESIEIFHPIHDVFGHQTSAESRANSNLFQVNYNINTEKSYIYTNSYKAIKDANGNYTKDSEGNKVAVWEKDWAKLIPKNSEGKYKVKDVGLWLWKRFIGDGGKNYQALEKAHITALLNGKDLGYFLNVDNPLKVYKIDDISSGDISIKITDGSVGYMNLDSSVVKDRREANQRVGLAIAFIITTPYIYAQEGI